MANVEEFVESCLAHYASQYYDPVKAHEYYLRNRELNGEKKLDVSELSKTSKETWQVTKSNIDKAKATEFKTIAGKHSAETERVRQAAQQQKAQLQNSIKELFERLKADRQTSTARVSEVVDKLIESFSTQKNVKLEKIRLETQAKLNRIPPLPKGSSVEARERRAQKITKIKGDAKTKSSLVINNASKQIDELRNASAEQKARIANSSSQSANQARESSRANAEQITAELNATIDKAKKTYEGLKVQTKAKYEATYQREFEAIKQDI